MTPVQIMTWGFLAAEVALPVIFFSAKPVTQFVISKPLLAINPEYVVANGKYKAANENTKEYKARYRAAKKHNKNDENLKPLKRKWKNSKTRAKHLKKLRKKSAPMSRTFAKVAGITASFTLAAAALSGLKAYIDIDDKNGLTANIVHTQESQWFDIFDFIGLGSSSQNVIIDASYSAQNGFDSTNRLNSYKHYPELRNSIARTIGTGAAVYLVFFGICGGFDRRRSNTFHHAAGKSLKILSCVLPPLAYLSASGFQIHPEWSDHKNTTRIALNFDYDAKKAFIQFGPLYDIFAVNITLNDFTVAYIRMYYTSNIQHDGFVEWISSSVDFEGKIHPKVKKALQKEDEKRTQNLVNTIRHVLPASFGQDTVVEWVEGQIFESDPNP